MIIGDRSSDSPATRLHNRFRVWTHSMRRLPDFVVIGANGSGTTSFYWNLARHPAILPTATKEVHFFDRHWQDGLDWYRAHFPLAAGTRGKMTGEATPSYLFRPEIPERLAATVPDAKLIALLRNPVDRAYGHYHKRFRKGSVTLPFEAVARAELARLGERPIDAQTFAERVAERDAQRGTPADRLDLDRYDGTPFLLRGVYAPQIEMWRKFFPAEQMLVLASEEYYAEPLALLRKTARDFLGLADWWPQWYDRRNEGHRYPPMAPDLRAELEAFYRPHNEALAALIGHDLGWRNRGAVAAG